MDMFTYSAIAIPTLNAIDYMIGKYNMTVDTLPSNFMSLGVGITTIIAKYGINFLIDKLKSKLKLNKNDILNDIDDVSDPAFKDEHPDLIDQINSDSISKEKLINEQ